MKLCKYCDKPAIERSNMCATCASKSSLLPRLTAARDRLRELTGLPPLNEPKWTHRMVEVRHGYWHRRTDEAGYEFGICSVCGYIEWDAFPVGRTPNHCPNCGEKMDGKGESE